MPTNLEIGALVRGDGSVVQMRYAVNTDGTVRVTDVWGGHPGVMQLGQEGTRWARGEWGSPDVVALRALAAIERAR